MTMVYETSATATHEGRSGSVRSADGLLDLRLALPKELGGPGGATNPEQLFAAGYAACFTSALLSCAREAKLSIGAPEVTARVGLERGPDGGFRLAAGVDVALPGATRADAETATRGAHAICPYSQATRGNVDVKVRLLRWKGSADAPALLLEPTDA
jgi:Ohr subfamily peroxiredoxin